MSDKSRIDWCDATWNPVTGCKHGCTYCYARRMAKRLQAMGQANYVNGFEPTFHPGLLDRPSRWKRPRKIFVCSMADLFGDWVQSSWIWEVRLVMEREHRHTFQLLTKNPARMVEWPWSQNVWCGVTAITQDEIDHVMPYLVRMRWRGGLRFVSAEPIHGPIKLPNNPPFKWLIIGRQTGPGAPEIDPRWVTDLTEQAHDLGLAVFHKHNLGALATLSEFPES